MTNLKIQLFATEIDDLNNPSAYKKLSSSDLQKASEKYEIEVKEASGCKIEFLVDKETKKSVAALISDEETGEVREKLDKDNTEFAYSDFNGFLGL